MAAQPGKHQGIGVGCGVFVHVRYENFHDAAWDSHYPYGSNDQNLWMTLGEVA